MSLNFPNSPALNQIYTTPDGTSFFWNGVQWVGFSSSVVLNINTVPLSVEDDSTVVGSAITSINFGEYLDVTYASDRVTVDVNNVWTETNTGNLYRLNSNIGIGTTNPRYKLEVGEVGYSGTSIYVNGGVKVTGLVTFATLADSEYGGRGYLTLGGETSVDGFIVGYYKDKTNIVLGHSAGSGTGISTTSRRNIFIGEETGINITQNGSSENIYIGAYAGGSYSDANNNVFIGNGVGYSPSAPSLLGSYNVMIGPTGGSGASYDTNNSSALLLPPVQQGSYQLVIGAGNTAWIHGNSSFNIGFGTNSPSARLHVQGGSLITGITTTSDLNIGVGYTNIRLYSGGIDLNIDAGNNSTKLNLYSYFPGSDPHAISIEAPPGADVYSLILPLTNGSQYESLTTDGDGNLSWAYPSKWYPTVTGIYTGSTVSIGTTNSDSTLTVNGTANISGILTASSFFGNGIGLSGIVTSIVAGSNIAISTSFGRVTIDASLSVPQYWNGEVSGISTQSNVGIGTTNATARLTVSGLTSTTNLSVTGVSTLGQVVFNGSSVQTVSGNLTINSSGGTVTVDDNLVVNDDFTVNAGIPGIGVVINGTNSPGYYRSRVDDVSGNRTEAMTIGRFQNLDSYKLYNNGDIETIGTISVGSAGTVITTTGIGSIGIGTISPQDRVHITGSTLIDNSVRVGNIANGEFRVGSILTGLGTLPGLLVSSTHGTVISNNTGSSGGYYLRTNGTNRWYVDNLSNQFGTGRFQLGPNISSPLITLDTAGNASISGITTTVTLNVGTAGTVITTLSNGRVGVGSTLPSSRLTVEGNARISGITTSALFSGNVNSGIVTASSIIVGSALTANESGINATGIITAFGGLSTGNGTITFSVVGSNLVVSVAGIGSTTLALG